MTGGLLNLVCYGNSNIIVNGNPEKNFFKATYKKYTNFGLQKHIVKCNVTNSTLRDNNPSTFEFTIPRIGDLILDTFFCIEMPHIWSPVFVEPTDIYDCPGGLRSYSKSGTTGSFVSCDASLINQTDCNNISCTPEDMGLNPCGNLTIEGSDCFSYDNSCVPVPKILSGLYNIDDASGSAQYFPQQIGYAHVPYVQGFEFKWIKNFNNFFLFF